MSARLEEEDDASTASFSSTVVAIRRLLPLAEKSRAYLGLAFALLLSNSLVRLLLPQLLRLAIDGPLAVGEAMSTSLRLSELATLAKICMGLLAVGFSASYLSNWLLQKFGQSLVLGLRQRLFEKLHRLPITYFDQNAIGRTVSRVVNDSNSLAELFTQVLAAGIGDALLLVGICLVLLLTDPSLFLILGLFVPLLVVFVSWFRRHTAPLYKVQRVMLAKLNGFFSELLEGLSTVKSLQAESYQAQRFEEINSEYLNNELKLLGLVAAFRPGFAVMRTAATALLIGAGGYSILEGRSSVGTLVSSLLYVRLLFAPLEQLAERYNVLIRATVAAERVLAIIDSPEETTGQGKAPAGPLSLSFDKVSYHYAVDKPVLKNISFTLEKEQSLALVGPTGSGKSTIISLLLGFYALDEARGHQGQIKINGQNLNELRLSEWRKSLAFVSQDLFMFKASLSHNVSLFQDISPEDIDRALQESDCTSFVSNLPKGSQTLVGDKNHSLSTGQRQLLAFARALAYQPELLILDEATANIDSETEAKIEKALDRLLKGRQAIIVAHRLSTVKRADKILVLDHGQIKESGTHEELMLRRGLYAEMVEKSQGAAPKGKS